MILFSVLSAQCAFAATKGAGGAQWASVEGYYPGMSKAAAKKAGLANCKSFLGTVECTTPEPLKIGSITAISSRLEFDERSGVLEKIEVQFPAASFKTIASTISSQLGVPVAKDSDYEADDWRRRGYSSSCGSVHVWHRKADDAVVVCGESGRRGGLTHLVADRIKGRGKEWREAEAERKKDRQSADSFNSK